MRPGVVICDDHRMFVEVLAVTLEGRGYRVLACATTPDKAVEAVQSYRVELCLLDLGFPGAAAISAIADIRSVSPATRVVALSAAPDERTVGRAVLAGASSVFDKSEGVDRIIEAMERVREGQVVVHDLVPTALDGLTDGNGTNSSPQTDRCLTRREWQVLQGLVRGQSTAMVASEMGVRLATARTHTQNLLAKLGVHSKLEAVALAVEEGLVTVEAAGT